MRSERKPIQSVVGRNSAKHSRVGTGTTVGAGGASGQVPVAALVLLARICSMSGNTRVGFVVTAFRPGELYFSESASGMSTPVAELAEERAVGLECSTSAVPTVVPPEMPPRSICSHM